MKNKFCKILLLALFVLSSFSITKLDSIVPCSFGIQQPILSKTVKAKSDLPQTNAAQQNLNVPMPVEENVTQNQQTNLSVQDLQTNNENKSVPPVSTQMSIPEKNLNHLKQIGLITPKNKFLKFIIAMFGVIISGLAIYGGLKFYKNMTLAKKVILSDPNDERSLESPKDFKTAINLFLNKTDT